MLRAATLTVILMTAALGAMSLAGAAFRTAAAVLCVLHNAKKQNRNLQRPPARVTE